MTPQELKNSILQLAIQGKLVEQRSEEGTAEELYKQIQVEKQRLIKAGSIKKEKPLPEITEDEKPFDIPDSWQWVRLRTIVYNRGQEVPSALFSYIDIGSIDNKNQRLNAEENLIEADKAPSRARKIVELGDILYSTVRPYLHNMCIIDRQFSCRPIASTGFAAMTCYEGIYNKYLFFYLMSPAFDSYANDTENAKGVAYPAINDDRLYRAVIPLPPLAEQKRIVAKIEELLPYIDRYEQAWSKLEDFNKRFPIDMQKSILQMAIQGKLVDQRPEEGTGEELYQQIQAEKQRLIKVGTIKKEKPLSEITEDEKPFDIPDSWMWVRLGNVAVIQSSKRVFEKDYVADGIPFYRSKEIGNLNRGEEIQTELFITRKHYEQLKESYGVPEGGDILITSVGTIGNTWICDDREFYYKDGNITQICSNDYFEPAYIERFIHSPVFEMQALSTVSGTAYSALTIIKLKNIIIPLPPLAEQKRIVAKLEEILPLCEKLK